MDLRAKKRILKNVVKNKYVSAYMTAGLIMLTMGSLLGFAFAQMTDKSWEKQSTYLGHMTDNISNRIIKWNTDIKTFNSRNLPVTKSVHSAENFQIKIFLGKQLNWKKKSYQKSKYFDEELINGTSLTMAIAHLFFLIQIYIIYQATRVSKKKRWRGVNITAWVILVYLTANQIRYIGNILTETYMVSDLCRSMISQRTGMSEQNTIPTARKMQIIAPSANAGKGFGTPKKPSIILNLKLREFHSVMALSYFLGCMDVSFQQKMRKQLMDHSMVELALLKHSVLNLEDYNTNKKSQVFKIPKTSVELIALDAQMEKVEELSVTYYYLKSLQALQEARQSVETIAGCRVNNGWIQEAKMGLCIVGIRNGGQLALFGILNCLGLFFMTLSAFRSEMQVLFLSSHENKYSKQNGCRYVNSNLKPDNDGESFTSVLLK